MTRRATRSVLAAILACFLLAVPATAQVTSDRPAAIVHYPLVRVDSAQGIDTLVQLTNVRDLPTDVYCVWENHNGHCSTNPSVVCASDADCEATTSCVPGFQTQDFQLGLTVRQPLSWSASQGRLSLPLPENTGAVVPVPEDPFTGSLRCVALDVSGIPGALNVLQGEATIEQFRAEPTPVLDAAKYNAIGIPAVGGDVNGDGTLLLDGIEYAACPNSVLLNHFFDGATDPATGATRVDTVLVVVPCSLDGLLMEPAQSTLQYEAIDEFGLSLALVPEGFSGMQASSLSDIAAPLFDVGERGSLVGRTRLSVVGGSQVLAVLVERRLQLPPSPLPTDTPGGPPSPTPTATPPGAPTATPPTPRVAWAARGAHYLGIGPGTDALVLFDFTPTPGSLPTFTPTLTATTTPTNTPSNTATNTPTPTPSNTPTNTPTRTPTSTPTNTASAVATNTPTDTPAATPTNTPTNTPTASPTHTGTNTPTLPPTPTPTSTPSNTPMPTASNTPTNTPTPTPSNTPTNTPTSTLTNTATGTPTHTPTSTPTLRPNGSPCEIGPECASAFCVDGVCCNTEACPDGQFCNVPAQEGTCAFPAPSPTSTPPFTATNTPQPTSTPSVSPTSTTTDTPTGTPTTTPSDTPTDTPTGTPVSTATHTSTVTPTDTPTTTPMSTPTDTPTLAPTLTATRTGTQTPTPTPTHTPSPTPTPDCITLRPAAAGLSTAQNQRFGCEANWQCAQSDDGDDSYVFSEETQSIGSRSDLYTLEQTAPQPDPITAVVLRTRSRSVAGALSSTAATLFSVDGTAVRGIASLLSTAYTEVTSTYTTNPLSGTAWSWDQVNRLQVGVQHRVAGGDEVRTTSVSVDVCRVPLGLPTFTPSRTVPPTATPSAIPSATPPSTPTSTQAPTATSTSTPTGTPSRTPTARPTGTTTSTPSPTWTPTPTSTGSPTPTPTEPPAPTPTGTPTDTLTPTQTGTATPPPTATPVPCTGDCDGDGTVDLGELVRCLHIANGDEDVGRCAPCDRDGNGSVDLGELVGSLNNANDGCPLRAEVQFRDLLAAPITPPDVPFGA